MRALMLALALAACTTTPAPPAIYPEAELAPGHTLTPIRRLMPNVVFTNAVGDGANATNLEGYTSDGSYKFRVELVGDVWRLTRLERVGDAPPAP